MEKVAFASFAGTAIEFYAFYISRTAAAIVLGGVPPRALRDEDPIVRGSRQLQSRRGFRGCLRAPHRGRVAVDLALRPGDGRRKLRLQFVALGDLRDGPSGDPGRGAPAHHRGPRVGGRLSESLAPEFCPVYDTKLAALMGVAR